MSKPKKSQEQFLQEAYEVYGDSYDYSKTVYFHSHSKVIIVCKKHGIFERTPSDHIRGSGCFSCSKGYGTTTEFIEEAIKVHSNKYDYSLVKYVSPQSKVLIICPIHGSFEQSPHNHLLGKECTKCVRKDWALNNFIKKSILVHKLKYNYNKSEYVSNNTLIEIGCYLHGSFLIYPSQHLNGRGCLGCISKGGFDKNKSAICYYIKFELENQTLYKIGITNISVKNRLRGMRINEGVKTTILQELRFEYGKDALDMERGILKEFEEFKYQGMPIMDNGNSELFTKDILNLNL